MQVFEYKQWPSDLFNMECWGVRERVCAVEVFYEQLGLRSKFYFSLNDQSLELRPECRSRPKRVSACAVVNKDPRCVRKRQSEPRYACLWT
jgi:hypothetical protein